MMPADVTGKVFFFTGLDAVSIRALPRCSPSPDISPEGVIATGMVICGLRDEVWVFPGARRQ
jgi:hypothetical protein